MNKSSAPRRVLLICRSQLGSSNLMCESTTHHERRSEVSARSPILILEVFLSEHGHCHTRNWC
ncbi:hypothetical protein P692DRAFT_20763713 [Suillus brevipes Sb2]|nr:hypothetical protein P692DRAFT_20763713 [Suillus brevipes Sb2]